MAVLLLFAMAREAAGTNRVVVDGDTVGAVIDAAVERFGDRLEQVVAHCKVWRNGEPASRETPVGENDEVALLPPVSGGCVPLPLTKHGRGMRGTARVRRSGGGRGQ